jgi:hypothetical protein
MGSLKEGLKAIRSQLSGATAASPSSKAIAAPLPAATQVVPDRSGVSAVKAPPIETRKVAAPLSAPHASAMTPVQRALASAGDDRGPAPDLPRSSDLSKVDWWARVSNGSETQWALIEIWRHRAPPARVFFVDGSGCVTGAEDAPSEVEAKRRLMHLGFDRRAGAGARMRHLRPPSQGFQMASKPPASSKPAGMVIRRTGPGAASATTTARKAEAVTKVQPQIRADEDAMCMLDGSLVRGRQFVGFDRGGGYQTQCGKVFGDDVHEVAIGLDFGTSTTKVVLGDSSFDRAFAVPFCKGPGIDQYLLPTRLYGRSERRPDGTVRTIFALDSGTEVFRDLKLSWLANPHETGHATRIVAFLALVIRHTRAWMFETHRSIYKSVKIAWRFSIGLPAESAVRHGRGKALQSLATRAWRLSCQPGDIDDAAIAALDEADSSHADDDVQIEAIPEIAAQIYGFITSDSFDRHAHNLFLLVDIGAGTIDSSLFRVRPARGRKWNFQFYTAVVQPNGAANLHAHRIDWWQSMIAELPGTSSLKEALERHRNATDIEGSLPVSYREYMHGVRVLDPGSQVRDPDEAFLDKRVVAQVRGQTLHRAWQDNLIGQGSIYEVPMFLCGGGARMPFYQRINDALGHQHGFQWLQARPREFVVPQNLECDASIHADYDRLSVAYGLSRLDVGLVTQAQKVPQIDHDSGPSFTDRYVSKDQV